MSANLEQNIPAELKPKPGFLTSAFTVWLATFVAGGIISFAIRRGLPKEAAEGSRSLLTDALRDLLPLLWLTVSYWLGRAYLRTRDYVTRAKAEALKEWAKNAQPPTIQS